MTTEEYLQELDRIRDASTSDDVATLLAGYRKALIENPQSRWLPYLCGYASGDLAYRLLENAAKQAISTSP